MYIVNKKGKIVMEFENKAMYKRIDDTVHTEEEKEEHMEEEYVQPWDRRILRAKRSMKGVAIPTTQATSHTNIQEEQEKDQQEEQENKKEKNLYTENLRSPQKQQNLQDLQSPQDYQNLQAEKLQEFHQKYNNFGNIKLHLQGSEPAKFHTINFIPMDEVKIDQLNFKVPGTAETMDGARRRHRDGRMGGRIWGGGQL